MHSFPILAQKAIPQLHVFPSTWKCEQVFSATMKIKSKSRNGRPPTTSDFSKYCGSPHKSAWPEEKNNYHINRPTVVFLCINLNKYVSNCEPNGTQMEQKIAKWYAIAKQLRIIGLDTQNVYSTAVQSAFEATYFF